MYKLLAVLSLGFAALFIPTESKAGVDVGIAIGVPFYGDPYYYAPGPVYYGPRVVYRDYPRPYYYGPRHHGNYGRPYYRGYRDGYRDHRRYDRRHDDRRGRGRGQDGYRGGRGDHRHRH